MLYLAIFLVMTPIILPSGAREIADLLKGKVEITLRMKILYIVVMTLCCITYVPAGVYVAREWGGIFAIFYFAVGFFLLVIPIAYEDDKEPDEAYEPNFTTPSS
jgi:uncharacterized membrane protein